jgi:hypothetical protein
VRKRPSSMLYQNGDDGLTSRCSTIYLISLFTLPFIFSAYYDEFLLFSHPYLELLLKDEYPEPLSLIHTCLVSPNSDIQLISAKDHHRATKCNFHPCIKGQSWDIFYTLEDGYDEPVYQMLLRY